MDFFGEIENNVRTSTTQKLISHRRHFTAQQVLLLLILSIFNCELCFYTSKILNVMHDLYLLKKCFYIVVWYFFLLSKGSQYVFHLWLNWYINVVLLHHHVIFRVNANSCNLHNIHPSITAYPYQCHMIWIQIQILWGSGVQVFN